MSLVLMTMATGSHARFLQPGESIVPGTDLHSENNRYVVRMQGDGNFIVYRNDGSGHAVWSTATIGSGATTATMQWDGNFVLRNGAGQAVWATGTRGRDRTFTLTEFGQAVVVSPGKRKRIPGPGSEMFRRLHLKPDWLAQSHDAPWGSLPSGPRCVGNPRKCAGL